MKGSTLRWFSVQLLLFVTVCTSYSQKIEPVYSRQIQYRIINGRPKYADKKRAAMIISSLSDIRYALNHHYGKKILDRGEIQVAQSNITFYIDGADSLMTTVYSLRFSRPVDGKTLNEYERISFPPGIIPEDDYILWKSPTVMVIVSIFFNMAPTEDSEDYIRRQKKQQFIQNWIKEQ